jgi:hypothetical protein
MKRTLSGLMARGPCTFRQKDLTRAIKAAQAAGVSLRRVWVEADGRIVLSIADEARVDHDEDSNVNNERQIVL